MLWPPSAPMSEATRPEAWAARTSAALTARASSPAYRVVIVRTKSTCSRVAVTARSPAQVAST